MATKMHASASYTAVNRHSVDLHKTISQSFEQAIHDRQDLFLYALIDCAFNEKFIRQCKTRHPSLYAASLYTGSELDELQDVSPVLVQLPLDESTRSAWLETLLQRADGLPMLSFLASPIDTNDLASSFAPFLKSETEDGQRYLLRFADTRILPKLIAVLDDLQWSLLPPIAHWWSIDRMGVLKELQLPRSSHNEATEHTTRLKLSNLQFAALLDAAEADAIIEQLLLVVPEHCSAFRPGDLYNFIAQQLEYARRFGIESTPDLVAYCVGAFNLRGKLHEDPHASALLNEGRWRPGELSSALAELPEECWSHS